MDQVCLSHEISDGGLGVFSPPQMIVFLGVGNSSVSEEGA